MTPSIQSDASLSLGVQPGGPAIASPAQGFNPASLLLSNPSTLAQSLPEKKPRHFPGQSAFGGNRQAPSTDRNRVV